MPFSLAISMYGLAKRLTIDARVMRIMWATTTSVKVNTGNAETFTRSKNPIKLSTLEIAGNT